MQEFQLKQHGNLWPLTGVHSQAEVLDTAERWLNQEESQRSEKFLLHSTLPLIIEYVWFRITKV